MGYRLDDLGKDMRKALSLPPGEIVKRFAGRAVRYARRIRNRRRAGWLSDAELLAACSGPIAGVDELIRRRRESDPLVGASRRTASWVEAVRRRAPESLEPLVAAARMVDGGTFDLLGSGPVRLGGDPDWHLDFKSGQRWDPAAFSLEIFQTPDRGHDIKVPWELSRLQHLPTLGIAAAITADESLRRRGVAHIESFVAGNRPYRGVNWNCTMDVALRAAQILAAEGYLGGEERAVLGKEALKSLLLHGRFIRENLEDGPVRGNHFLSDLAGLYLCGLGLPEFRESDGWRAFARTALAAEMPRQVTPDGADYEASISYHAFATEMFLFPALFGAEKQDPFPDDYLRRLERMVDLVAGLIRPDGSLPQIGDNDDGRFLIFSQYHRPRRDWRPLLALGGWLFRRSDWLRLAGDAWVEGAWVAGEPFLAWSSGREPAADPPVRAGRAFPDAGWYQLGSGEVRMVVDTGNVGQGMNGGHAHNDTLAFDLFAFGSEVLPDRGTGAYTPDLKERDRFRSTAAHNTVQVDGEEINPIPAEPFRLIPADAPRVRRWRSGSRFAYLHAEHHGYARLPRPVIHRRRILADGRQGRYLLEDRLEGEGRHVLDWRFHLAPGWSAELNRDGFTARPEAGRGRLEFRWTRPPEGVNGVLEEDLHSPSYGTTRPARVVRWRAEIDLPGRARFTLAPHREEVR